MSATCTTYKVQVNKNFLEYVECLTRGDAGKLPSNSVNKQVGCR